MFTCSSVFGISWVMCWLTALSSSYHAMNKAAYKERVEEEDLKFKKDEMDAAGAKAAAAAAKAKDAEYRAWAKASVSSACLWIGVWLKGLVGASMCESGTLLNFGRVQDLHLQAHTHTHTHTHSHILAHTHTHTHPRVHNIIDPGKRRGGGRAKANLKG